MAEVVAEAVLSVSLELLFEKLASSDVLRFARQKHVQTHLKDWEKKLLEIGEFLNDAEEKQIAKKSVKAWLSDLRDLAYDMEDVLDEFSYEALRRNLMAEGSTSGCTSSKVRKFIPSFCTPVQAIRSVKMGSQIKEITTRLDAICAQKVQLGLDKVAAITHSTWERPLSTSLAYQPWVYGRDADKKIIMDMLLRDDEPNQTNFCVVSIVAMGGMGKTTLARLVYDDPETSKHFNLKAWALVSDQFDALSVTQTILKEVTSGSSSDSQKLGQIQEKLREALKGKKFLLVLDDIWNENYGDWDCLRVPFLSAERGSRIIVTTRSKNVATMMGGHKNLYELKSLSEDDCWLVFQNHAFENININEHPTLVSIGREIVKKCGGLPLAARALGGLLRREQREEKWNIILTNSIWDNDKCDILPVLRLSYNHLPSPLKRCFGYCAIFPKDYEFDKEELIRLWMAEGFIQQSESSGQKIEMEDLGDDYFQELLSRSFFQASSSNESHFLMHDLVNDLAKFVAREICFPLEVNLERNQRGAIYEKFRHSSFTRGRFDVFKKFEVFHRMEEHLRTFVCLPIDASWHSYWLSNKVLEKLIPKLKCLRVLSLSGYCIIEIPNSVGDLKHLRYLNLSSTKVKWLPESIGNLYMLETLKLSDCSNLMRLPLSIGNLKNLRYLDYTNTPLKEMPPQVSELKNLRVLTTFIVGKDNDLSVKKLRNMSRLRGRLQVSKLENVINVQDARDASLNKKLKLEKLILSWSDSQNVGNQVDILDSLRPHFGLNEVIIDGGGGPKFPQWLEDVRFCKMVQIELQNCKNCTSLPCLGQLPMLKHLVIQGMDEVKNVGKEFHGKSPSFPMLESLTFSNMSKWEDWENPSLGESYPCLLRLSIGYCPKLIKELPTYLPSLVDLSIQGCPRLESPLARFPSLSRLCIYLGNEGVIRSGVDLHSLEEFKISFMMGLTRLNEGLVQLLSKVQVLDIRNCDELRCLWEDGFDNIQQLQSSICPGLASLGDQEHDGLFSRLQSLEIRECHNLEKLPNGLHRLTCLKELKILHCPKLSFPNTGLPPMLTRLEIVNCPGLTRPDWIMVARDGSNNHVCILENLRFLWCRSLVCFPDGCLPPTLQKLSVEGCKNLESLPEGELPTNLKQLDISYCKKLKSLPSGTMHHHDSNTTSSDDGLIDVSIQECPSLKFFPAGKFHSTLRQLIITNCQQLESISERMFHSNNNSLKYLEISEYPSLKIIPDCLYNLRCLRISKCENLVRLPHQLQNLEILSIRGCRNVELLPYQLQSFTALTSLDICNCESMRMPLSQWGLATLTSLEQLTLEGIFPEQLTLTSFSDAPTPPPPLLPTSLTFLYLRTFHNLKSLSSVALETLTSLEQLLIENCPEIESFCPKEGLPDRLSLLYIGGCPVLLERCSKGKGPDWPNISHIPNVLIDSENIVAESSGETGYHLTLCPVLH